MPDHAPPLAAGIALALALALLPAAAPAATVRGFSCLTAQALEELRFARCSKPGNGNELFKVIRFDFGS